MNSTSIHMSGYTKKLWRTRFFELIYNSQPLFLQGLVNLLTKKQPQIKHHSNPSTHFPALHPGAMVPSKGGKVDKVDGQNASLPPKVKPWLGEAEAEAKAFPREYLRFEICDFHCKGLSKTVPLRHRDEILGFFNVFFPSFKTWGGGWENRTMEGVCVCVCVFFPSIK